MASWSFSVLSILGTLLNSFHLLYCDVGVQYRAICALPPLARITQHSPFPVNSEPSEATVHVFTFMEQ